MSRPRKPFGTELPGRVPGTMLRVLAAELSEPGRLSRGKRAWADDAVIDLVVGHGVLTAEVQGSRPDPYVVTIQTDRGRGVPRRKEVRVHCTCPDDEGFGVTACKHGVAALFSFADEVTIDPAVLDRWRRTAELGDDPAPARIEPAAAPRPPALHDALEPLLAAPRGAVLPTVPHLEPREIPPGDRVVAAVLADALERLRVRWG